MSLSFRFTYDVSDRNGDYEKNRSHLEVAEVNTDYFGWWCELTPEELVFVGADFAFVRQAWEIGNWEDCETDPFPAEQAREWALLWQKLWQTDTHEEVIEDVKVTWGDDTRRIMTQLEQVIAQAECAERNGLLLRFSVSS